MIMDENKPLGLRQSLSDEVDQHYQNESNFQNGITENSVIENETSSSQFLDPLHAINQALVDLERLENEIPTALLDEINQMNEPFHQNNIPSLPEPEHIPVLNSSVSPDLLIQIQNALSELENNAIPALNPSTSSTYQTPINSPLTEQVANTPPLQQQGGSVSQNNDPVAPQARVISRHRFCNYEIRQVLRFPSPTNAEGVVDYAQFYNGTLEQVDVILQQALSHRRPQDVVQLELRGENLRNNVSVILQDG